MKLTCQRAKEIRDNLRNCSTEAFLQQWRSMFREIRSCFDDVKSIKNSLTLEPGTKAACLLLHDFLAICSSFPAVSRELASFEKVDKNEKLEKVERLSTLLLQILRFESVDTYVLLALEAFLAHYPQVCARHVQKSIKPHLLLLADQSCFQSRYLAAKCFAHVPLLGPAGEKRSKHAENWAKQMFSLLKGIVDSLSVLLASSNHQSDGNGSLNDALSGFKCNEKLFLADLESTDVEKISCRIDFCLQTIIFMINGEKMSNLRIKLPHRLLCALLDYFNEGVKNGANMRRDALGAILVTYAKFCDVLALLADLAKFALIPHCGDVFFALESTLYKLNSIQNSGSELCVLRCSILGFFTGMAGLLGNSSRIDAIAAKFWPAFKGVLNVFEKNVDKNSVIAYESKQKTNNKKRKSAHHTDTKAEDNLDFVDQFVKKPKNFEDTRAFIKSGVEFFIAVASKIGSILKPAFYSDLQRTVSKLLLSVLANGLESDLVGPYEDPQCRLALLRLLHAAVFVRHPTVAPAIQCFLRILMGFRSDPDLIIRDWCAAALATINGLTKPRVASLECVTGDNDCYNARDFVRSKSNGVEESSTEIMETLSRIMGRKEVEKLAAPEIKQAAEIVMNVERVSLLEDSPEPIVVNIDGEDDDFALPKKRSSEKDEDSDVSVISLKKFKSNSNNIAETTAFSENGVENLGKAESIDQKLMINVDTCSKSLEKANYDDSNSNSIDRSDACEKLIDISKIDDLIADFVEAPADRFEDI